MAGHVHPTPAIAAYSDGTPLGYHQLAVRQMMAKEGGDRWSLLLMHGTGVGKTFSCIAVAEAAMGPFGGRTLVVAPDITHTQYVDSVLESQRSSYPSGDRASVLERYDIVTYESLHRAVGDAEHRGREYDCVILDEAHAIRNDHAGAIGEALAEMREVALRRPRRTKLVLATATPMFDRADNIFPLLALLAWNDGDAALAGRLSDGSPKRRADALREACRYVSYLDISDTDPAFADRRYGDSRGLLRSGSAELGRRPFVGEGGAAGTGRGAWLDTLPFCVRSTPLTANQSRSLHKILRDAGDESAPDAPGATDALLADEGPPPARVLDAGKFANALLPASVPGNVDAVLSALGRYPHPKKGLPAIYAACPKVRTVVDLVLQGPRPALVYSRFFARGIVPVLAALEGEGFVPALHAARGRFFRGGPASTRGAGLTYAVVTSGTEHGDRASAVSKLTRPGGKGVDVILITDKASTGFDLSGIRQVHVLDPWWNVSKLMQVTGRAFRFRAHDHLPESERWCDVHVHAVTDTHREEETPDVWMLRIAAEKYRQVRANVEVIRREAVDCTLFRGRNGVDRCSTTARAKSAFVTADDLARGLASGWGLEAFIANVAASLRRDLRVGDSYGVPDLAALAGVTPDISPVFHASLGRIVWPNFFRQDADLFPADGGRYEVVRRVPSETTALTFNAVDSETVSAKVYDMVRSSAQLSPVACAIVALTNVGRRQWPAVRTIANADPAVLAALESVGLVSGGVLLIPFPEDASGALTRGVVMRSGELVDVQPVPFPLTPDGGGGGEAREIPATLALSPTGRRIAGVGEREGARFQNVVVRGRLERKGDTFAFKLMKRDGSRFGRECHTESMAMLTEVFAVAASVSSRAAAAEIERVYENAVAAGRVSICAVVADALWRSGYLEVAML